MAVPKPVPSPEPEDLSGSTVGRFQIQSLLGAGGMGEVYRAQDTVLKRAVALKRVSHKLGADPRARQRILKEAQRACALSSAHIASVYDVMEDQGEVFLVMEYVEGQTLRQRLRTGGAMPLEAFLGLAVQCAEALAAAHQKGIIHRDLKPENIMLTSAAQVKILDFGLARRLPTAEEAAITLSLESSGGFAGTPGYMAPEALLEQEVDGRADIFSLGVVFFEMVTGRNPFRADKPMATADLILHSAAPRVAEFVRDAPPDLDRILGKMLAKDPAQRYATAADLLVDLRALQRGAPVAALVPASTRFRRWARRAIGVAASVVIFLVVLTVLPAVRQHWKGWINGPPLPERKNLAVLPFVPVNDEPNARAFSRGLTETLTAKLTQLTDKYPLQVVPPSEVRAQGVSSVQQAYAGLGVNLVLEGSLQQSGKMVRVNYNLVDARTRRQLRADTVTADATDPFAVEDRVVSSVLHALDMELQAQERHALEARGTTQPAAYDLYLRGRGYLQEYQKPENIDSAIAVFQRALERDSSYGLAFAGLGESYWRKYEYTHDREWVDKAVAACEKASALGQGHFCLATVLNGTGQYEQAVVEYQRTLEQDPTSDDAYRGLASAYQRLGNMNEAEQTYRRAISVRPQYWAGYNWLGAFLFRQGRYQEAAEAFARTTLLAPDNYRGYYNLGGTLIAQGRYQEAIATLNRSVEIRPSPSAYNNLAAAYFYLGQFEQAAGTYQRALKLDERDYELWGNLGEAYYWAPGQHQEAGTAYRKAVSLAEDKLKVNPRDAGLLATLGLYHAMLGEPKPAHEYITRALAVAPGDGDVRYKAAIISLQAGDRKRALSWLEQAVAAGYAVNRIANNPIFHKLAGESRFRSLLEGKTGQAGPPKK